MSVLTFGPGDHPFFKFGHNAILIELVGGAGLVFNFGTFTFDDPALLPKFLVGRFMYWLSVGDRDASLAHYRESNRTIEEQELDLTPAERRALYDQLQENALPKNRAYLYDYFWDNCSTRVRDAIDRVLRGRVRKAAAAPATMSFRADSLRLVADLLWEYVALHFGLGSLTDRPMTAWEASFLPERLRDLLRTVRVPGDNGEKPLVKSERVLFRAQRPPALAKPPSWGVWFAVVGVAVGAALAGLGVAGRRRRPARVALGVVAGVLGLVIGLLGVILIFLWAFTNHRAAYANANILQATPVVLALVVFARGIARARPSALRRARVVATAAVVLAVLGLVLRATTIAGQDNWAFIALFLPLWAGLAYGLRRLEASAP